MQRGWHHQLLQPQRRRGNGHTCSQLAPGPQAAAAAADAAADADAEARSREASVDAARRRYSDGDRRRDRGMTATGNPLFEQRGALSNVSTSRGGRSALATAAAAAAAATTRARARGMTRVNSSDWPSGRCRRRRCVRRLLYGVRVLSWSRWASGGGGWTLECVCVCVLCVGRRENTSCDRPAGGGRVGVRGVEGTVRRNTSG